MKISVYAICKNEISHVTRFLQNAKEADEVVILDTGSTDDTLSLLRELEKHYANLKIYEHDFQQYPHGFRFDLARNICLDLVNVESDWCLFLDLDEVIEENWRTKLEAVFKNNENATSCTVNFIYSVDQYNRPVITYDQEKIHRRHAYRWIYPAHEVLYCVEGEGNQIKTDIVVQHLPDPNKSRAQYLDLLRLGVEEYPTSDRMVHYLAREYYIQDQHEKAKEWFLKHVNMNAWDLEKCSSYKYLSYIAQEEHDMFLAEQYLIQAIALTPDHRETWLDYAQMCFNNGDYLACVWATTRALQIVVLPSETQIKSNAVWREYPHHLAAVAYHRLGDVENAKFYMHKAYEYNKNDPRVIFDYCQIFGDVPESLKQESVKENDLST